MSETKVSTLSRAVAILDVFSTDQPTLGVREVARRVQMSSSAVGRLMKAMRELNILSQNPVTSLYSMGSRPLVWAEVYTSTLDIRTIALPFLHELHHATMETISLYIVDGTERVCIERLESPQSVRIVARVGRRLPLYAGSAGKVFLAFLPQNLSAEILSNTNLVPLTPKTIVDREKLLAELEVIRKQGYASSRGEWLVDASGVAAPIFDQSGAVVAAVTISGPGQRFTLEKMEEYSTMIMRVAREISEEMGYRELISPRTV
ncbi:MAG: IclR family transcriptional regulator [Anaerolineaceae bacterium]|nr:IclR family transcriptional regulator [Anaerolineaceae bacterium]